MIEVLKQALEAMEKSLPRLAPYGEQDWLDCKAAIASLRQAIEEMESQEPVSALWQHGETGRFRVTTPDSITDCDARWFKVGDLYLHPPQRTWVGLTGEMLLKAAQSSLAPEQYDHFEAMSKHQPDIYDRLAYAIRVQDE